jgi:hypothetical protein
VTVPAPPVPPPQDLHPLFRTQSFPERTQSEIDKRDSGSGLSPASSAGTIRSDFDLEYVYDKFAGELREIPAPFLRSESSVVFTPPAQDPFVPSLFTIPLRPATPLDDSQFHLADAGPSSSGALDKLAKTFTLPTAVVPRRLQKRNLTLVTSTPILVPAPLNSPTTQLPPAPPRPPRPSQGLDFADTSFNSVATKVDRSLEDQLLSFCASVPASLPASIVPRSMELIDKVANPIPEIRILSIDPEKDGKKVSCS